MQSHIRRVRVTWVINDIVYSDIGQEHHEATCVMNSISIIQSVSHSFTRSINQSVNLLNVTRRAMTTVWWRLRREELFPINQRQSPWLRHRKELYCMPGLWLEAHPGGGAFSAVALTSDIVDRQLPRRKMMHISNCLDTHRAMQTCPCLDRHRAMQTCPCLDRHRAMQTCTWHT